MNNARRAALRPRRSRRVRPERRPAVLPEQALVELTEQKTGWPGESGVLLTAWREALGPDITVHVVIIRFDETTGVLEVRAGSKAWATQVRFLAPQLVPWLNEESEGS
ncbi:hypothetical protein GCM10010252_26470 [Streptomyces aureoverticillatus]|nr:hypothetical protein GCM10010252_26470 [Streptomyces aureoverticillatus]